MIVSLLTWFIELGSHAQYGAASSKIIGYAEKHSKCRRLQITLTIVQKITYLILIREKIGHLSYIGLFLNSAHNIRRARLSDTTVRLFTNETTSSLHK